MILSQSDLFDLIVKAVLKIDSEEFFKFYL